jgi:hypothetical protein
MTPLSLLLLSIQTAEYQGLSMRQPEMFLDRRPGTSKSHPGNEGTQNIDMVSSTKKRRPVDARNAPHRPSRC